MTGEEVPTEERERREAEEAKEVGEYRRLVDEILRLRDDPGAEAGQILHKTSILLLLNPDFMTAWNLRRRALRHIFDSSMG